MLSVRPVAAPGPVMQLQPSLSVAAAVGAGLGSAVAGLAVGEAEVGAEVGAAVGAADGAGVAGQTHIAGQSVSTCVDPHRPAKRIPQANGSGLPLHKARVGAAVGAGAVVVT